MVWTVTVAEVPLNRRAVLGVGEPRKGQRHIGIAYRTEASAPLRFMHLAWHHDLRDDDQVRDIYRCVILADVPAELEPTIVAQCKRSSAADAKGIPFGFGYQPLSVTRDPVTDALRLRGPSGLTCATFVLAMLELANIRLADLSSWQDRQGDAEWKAGIVEDLDDRGADPAHVEGVRSDRNHTRVRPEDVAGAATVSPLPASFTSAVVRGASIVDELARDDGPPALRR